MKTKILKFLASPLGSIVKLMLVAAVAVITKDGGFKLDKQTLTAAGAAAVAALLVVIQNWLNKEFKNYGSK